MAAFAGENVMPGAIPVHSGFAQSGSGGDHRLVADRLSLHLVERNHILGVESGNAPGIGFEIVDQEGLFDLEFIGQTLGLDDPGKIGSFHPAVAHRASNAEASGVRMQVRSIDKFGHDLIQAGILAAGKDGCGDQAEAAIDSVEECQPGVGASDVACQNHFSKFLQWRPSRSSRSSASFGPQVPAA